MPQPAKNVCDFIWAKLTTVAGKQNFRGLRRCPEKGGFPAYCTLQTKGGEVRGIMGTHWWRGRELWARGGRHSLSSARRRCRAQGHGMREQAAPAAACPDVTGNRLSL